MQDCKDLWIAVSQQCFLHEAVAKQMIYTATISLIRTVMDIQLQEAVADNNVLIKVFFVTFSFI